MREGRSLPVSPEIRTPPWPVLDTLWWSDMEKPAQSATGRRGDAATRRRTYGSLFSGIGGLDLGFDRAGFECRFQIEIDPFCREILEKHWPGVPKHHDIRTATAAVLSPVDVLIGGFPCQDVSQAGKRVGIEGSRTGLWSEFARIIGELRPRFVVAENVPGLLTSRGAMGRLLGDLARLGYVGCWRCLRASEFGASHIRKRVFIVAYQPSARWDGTARPRQLLERRPLQAARLGDERADLANCPPGGRRELREPSGSGGLTDGSHEAVGHAAGTRTSGRPEEGGSRGSVGESGGRLADPSNRLIPQRGRRPEGRGGIGSAGADVSDTGEPGLPHTEQAELSEPLGNNEGRAASELRGTQLPRFAPGPSDPRWPAILRERPDLAPALGYPDRQHGNHAGSGAGADSGQQPGPAKVREPGETAAQSKICLLADGLPAGLDRAMQDRTKRIG